MGIDKLREIHEAVNDFWKLLKKHLSTPPATDDEWRAMVYEAHLLEKKHRETAAGELAEALAVQAIAAVRRAARGGAA